MPKHHQKKSVRHTPEQMYELVMSIDKYPEFLPWCTGMRIKSHSDDGTTEKMTADMMVAFKVLKEKFTSIVSGDKESRVIEIDYVDGPFKYLHNTWKFEKNEDGTCTIDFFIDFEFRNLALRALMNKVFDEAVMRMISAFDKRADDLYGHL